MGKTIYSPEHRFLVQRLQAARKLAGFDQEEAAKRLGKTQSYISKVEAGQSRVDIVELQDFARIYGQELDFFIGSE